MTSRCSWPPAVIWVTLAALIVNAPGVRADPIDDARRQWESGDARAAVVTLKQYLAQAGSNPAARALLGQVYLDLSSITAAEQEIKRAIIDGHLDPAAYRADLARAQMMQGKYAEVLGESTVGSAPDPAQAAELQAIRGEAYLAIGKPDEAQQAFDLALGLVPDHPGALLGQAKQAAARGETARARELVDQAIKANPKDSAVWDAQGELALSAEDPQAAEEAFTQAITTARTSWMPLYKRALARLNLGKLAEAQADIDHAAQQLPQFPGLNYARGVLLLKRQQPEQALAEFKLFLPHRPDDPQGLYLTGLALFQLQRYQEAEDHLTRACEVARCSSTVASLLGRTRVARGDMKGAEAALRPFADQQPPDPEVLKFLGDLVTHDGRPGEAGDLLRQALAVRPDDTQAPVRLATALLADGDRDGAERELRAILTANPADETAQVLLMQLLLAKGDTQAAVEQSQAFLAALPRSPHAQVARGLAYQLRGDEPAARQAFLRALALRPGFADAAIALAAAEQRAGRTDAARALYEQILATDPRHSDAILLLAQLDVTAGNRAAGLARLQEAVAKDPANLNLLLNLAQGYAAAGQGREALRTLLDAPPALAKDPRLLLARGKLELAVGQPVNAITTLEALVARQPEAIEAQLVLVSAYAEAKEAAGMQEHLFAAIRIDPQAPLLGPTMQRAYLAQTDLPAKSALVASLQELGVPLPGLQLLEARLSLDEKDYKEAQARLAALFQAVPNDREVLLMLLSAQVKARALDAAAATAGSWIAAHPDDLEVQNRLAQLAEMRGQPDLAIETYRNLVRAHPDDPVARNNLAMLLLEKDPAQAVEHAQAARRAAPDDPAVGDTLGQALLANGNAHAATEVLDKSYQVSPKNPAIAFHYARALMAAGDPARARSVLMPVMGKPFPEEEAARSLLMQALQ